MMIEEKFDAKMRWGGAESTEENVNFEKLYEAAERDMENRSLNASIHLSEKNE